MKVITVIVLLIVAVVFIFMSDIKGGKKHAKKKRCAQKHRNTFLYKFRFRI